MLSDANGSNRKLLRVGFKVKQRSGLEMTIFHLPYCEEITEDTSITPSYHTSDPKLQGLFLHLILNFFQLV